MYNLGIIRKNAEVVDIENKGTTTLARVQALGVNENAALRSARREVKNVISLPHQEVVKSEKLAEGTTNDKFMFTISD